MLLCMLLTLGRSNKLARASAPKQNYTGTVAQMTGTTASRTQDARSLHITGASAVGGDGSGSMCTGVTVFWLGPGSYLRYEFLMEPK